MKVRIEVDLTPLEARKLLGFPDVEPLQKAMMKQLEEKMGSAMTMMDPDTLMRQWGPIGLQSLEQFQKLLWSAASGLASGRSSKPESGGTG